MKVTFELEIILLPLVHGNHIDTEELYELCYPRQYNFSKTFLKMAAVIEAI